MGISRGKPATAAVVALALAGSGLAYAQVQSNGRPETDRVLATFDATFIESQRKVCQGQDAEYPDQVHALYKGTITSQDPRLNGELTITTDSLVRETGDADQPDPLPYFGPVQDQVKIQRGGRVVSQGGFYGIVDGPRVEGFIAGHSHAQQPEDIYESGELFGHFSAQIRPGGDLYGGVLGGPDATPADAAVIFSGSCPGPEVDEEPLPVPLP